MKHPFKSIVQWMLTHVCTQVALTTVKIDHSHHPEPSLVPFALRASLPSLDNQTWPSLLCIRFLSSQILETILIWTSFEKLDHISHLFLLSNGCLVQDEKIKYFIVTSMFSGLGLLPPGLQHLPPSFLILKPYLSIHPFTWEGRGSFFVNWQCSSVSYSMWISCYFS